MIILEVFGPFFFYHRPFSALKITKHIPDPQGRNTEHADDTIWFAAILQAKIF